MGEESHVLKHQTSSKAHESASTQGDDAEHEELTDDLKGSVPFKFNTLELFDCVKQNDGYYIVEHSLAKDTAVKFWLLLVVHDAYR